MADNKGHKLYGIFKKKYLDFHGVEYRGNAYRDAAMFKRVADDIGEVELLGIMEYYFTRRSKHDVKTLIFNYDEILGDKERQERFDKIREARRQRTRQRMEQAE